MKLSKEQRKLYDAFYESTHDDGVLDSKTELLVGLSAAMAMNCEPCTAYYVKTCKKQNISKVEMQSVLAKVMAVAAGQKRLQADKVLRENNIDFDEIRNTPSGLHVI